MRDFLWEGVDEVKGTHLVSCELVEKLVNLGVRIREFKES